MTVHIGRRKFLVAVSGAAAAWPARAWSQGAAKERQRIGWLSGSQTKVVKSFADYFLDGMRGFGYVDGRDFDFVPMRKDAPGRARQASRYRLRWTT